MAPPLLAVAFEIGGHAFAVRASQVSEVLPMVQLHLVPEMPPLLEGFVETDRDLIPVVRLARLLRETSIAEPADSLRRHLIVVGKAKRKIAWACDGGSRLISFAADAAVEVPPASHLNHCAEAVYSSPDGAMITLLDAARLLLKEEQVMAEELRARLEERIAESAT